MAHPPFTFRDAIGVALELADHHEAGTVLVVDPDRPDPPLVSATGPAPHSMLAALAPALTPPPHPPSGPGRGWESGRDGESGRGSGWGSGLGLLVTIERGRPLLTRADVALYRWASLILPEAGLVLADWIHTDGDLIRSAAFTSDPRRAWPRDPPHERLLDQIALGCWPPAAPPRPP